jgi:hypothetical protein
MEDRQEVSLTALEERLKLKCDEIVHVKKQIDLLKKKLKLLLEDVEKLKRKRKKVVDIRLSEQTKVVKVFDFLSSFFSFSFLLIL